MTWCCSKKSSTPLTDNTRPKPVSSPPLLLRAQNNCGPKSCFTTDSHSNHCTEITLSLLTQFSSPSLPSFTLAPAEMATKCQQTARNRNSKFQKPRPPPLPPPLLRLDCRGGSNLWYCGLRMRRAAAYLSTVRLRVPAELSSGWSTWRHLAACQPGRDWRAGLAAR